jgi:GntR family transcriptional repressor for pyruvate dehydrogenase complex
MGVQAAGGVAMVWAIAERTTLAEQATEGILQQIRDGRFRPGDRLPSQRELAASMGVGIAPVREALQRLEVLGVLSLRQGQNAEVVPFGEHLLLYDPELYLLAAEEASLAAVFDARETVEAGIAALAAQRATEADLAAIGHALERQMAEDHVDYETHRRLNNDFHLAVAAACHNSVLTRILTPLLGSWRLLQGVTTPDRLPMGIELHQAIYEAIRARDAEAAQRAMRAHFDGTAEVRRVAIEAAAAHRRRPPAHAAAGPAGRPGWRRQD